MNRRIRSFSVPGRSLGGQHSSPEQVEARPSVALALHELEFVDEPLRQPAGLPLDEAGPYRREVLLQSAVLARNPATSSETYCGGNGLATDAERRSKAPFRAVLKSGTYVRIAATFAPATGRAVKGEVWPLEPSSQ